MQVARDATAAAAGRKDPFVQDALGLDFGDSAEDKTKPSTVEVFLPADEK